MSSHPQKCKGSPSPIQQVQAMHGRSSTLSARHTKPEEGATQEEPAKAARRKKAPCLPTRVAWSLLTFYEGQDLGDVPLGAALPPGHVHLPIEDVDHQLNVLKQVRKLLVVLNRQSAPLSLRTPPSLTWQKFQARY